MTWNPRSVDSGETFQERLVPLIEIVLLREGPIGQAYWRSKSWNSTQPPGFRFLGFVAVSYVQGH